MKKKPTLMRECQMCGGPLVTLGALGTTTHFRCRNCGMEVRSGAVVLGKSDNIFELARPSAASDLPETKNRRIYRIFVYTDLDDSLIEIEECQVTSDSEKAQRIVGTSRCVALTEAETEWVVEALQAALAKRRERASTNED